MNTDDDYKWSRQSAADSIFYTFDDIIDTMDDDKIITDILSKYPLFIPDTTVLILKKLFLEILSDEKFITFILKKYHLTLNELFAIIFRQFPGTFETSGFIKKIRQTVETKSYFKYGL